MRRRVTFEELVEQLERIPAEWLDDVAQEVIDTISLAVNRIEEENALTQSVVEEFLRQERYALDVFRLFLDLSQDRLANEINSRGITGDFGSIRSKSSSDHGQEIASALVDLGILDTMEAYRIQEWTLEDILVERYKQMRGRAIRGQQRGAAMEEAIEDVLEQLHREHNLTYAVGSNFVDSAGQEAKADFMIPGRERPEIVIEAKGYEATGSKLTDVLGDILKILQVKDPTTRFIFVTDGIGWYRRLNDLRKIVEYHHRGDIDMIYTRKTLPHLHTHILEMLDQNTNTEKDL